MLNSSSTLTSNESSSLSGVCILIILSKTNKVCCESLLWQDQNSANTDLTQFKKKKIFDCIKQATTKNKKNSGKTTVNLQIICVCQILLQVTKQHTTVCDLCDTKYDLSLNVFSKHQKQPVGISCDMSTRNLRNSLLTSNFKSIWYTNYVSLILGRDIDQCNCDTSKNLYLVYAL